MQSETTTAITAVKQDVRLREWAEQLEAQQASGLTVPQWCAENGIKTKSFYYRLRRVREQYIQSAHAVVPLTVPQQQSADIRIEKNDLHISLPTSITKDTLLALVKCTAGQQPGRERDPTICDWSQELAFSNTANGAKASAVLYSIAATAQANGVDTEQYLTELFSQPAGTIILPLNT